ncbi:MAG: NAD(P)(+) transhydrogenase (Re/Si-specific) subunit beta [Saprospiraceae bacterium]
MEVIVQYIYLISVVLFVLGLKGLSHPESAKRGNLMAATGMILAIIASLVVPLDKGDGNYLWILGGLAIGGSIGFIAAKRVLLTKMPELVSLFNGFGGACSMLIAILETQTYTAADGGTAQLVIIIIALFIGSISFTGSLIAYGKLDGSIGNSLKLPFPQVVNLILLIAYIAVGFMVATGSADGINTTYLVILIAISLVYGVTFVLPIGGGDMPVVISLLNSFTGLAAAAAGLIYGDYVMIVGGILVGAAGTILTVMMCDAMNRSLLNVIIGDFGASSAAGGAARGEEVVKEANVSDVSIQLKYGQKIIIVPGYGLAVAQAQHICHDLDKALSEEGVQVKYAIHPVAGRMPGHMNVLLAEAGVDYDKLLELEAANEEFPTTDIVLVIGANDVVNPAALDDPSSPIYGMPILEVEKAKSVVVFKRSMNPGYSGIQNQLFFGDKTKMLFGDAKASLNKIKDEIGNV